MYKYILNNDFGKKKEKSQRLTNVLLYTKNTHHTRKQKKKKIEKVGFRYLLGIWGVGNFYSAGYSIDHHGSWDTTTHLTVDSFSLSIKCLPVFRFSDPKLLYGNMVE